MRFLKKSLAMLALLGANALGAGGGVVLTGDTSEPRTSTFFLGEKVEITFRATGGPAQGQAKLQVTVGNEHGDVIERKTLDLRFDEKGRGEVAFPAPGNAPGFYRVKAALEDGTELSALGSRRAGSLTYAVVPPSAERPAVTEKQAFFGMQGGYGPNGGMVMERLGIRWILDSSLNWNRNEPKVAGEYALDPAAGRGAPANENWETFTFPTLFHAPAWAVVPGTSAYVTGKLTEEGERAWEAYCRKAAAAYMAKYPDRQERIYQITWEPNPPWGFKGKDEDLIRIYEIAFKALHETDPKAVVAGPTRSLEAEEFEKIDRLLSRGLGQYLDAFTLHPYSSLEPERDGLVREIRALKTTVRKHKGEDIALLGTEQGGSTHENPEEELAQARGLMRQNLIMKGEGFRLNFAFYVVDYRTKTESGYGYYYNLVDGAPWAPVKMSPKPVAMAYAAQSFLLEGYEPVGAIEWLGPSVLGYAFQRGGDVILALWDFEKSGNAVSLPTGVDRVRVYDWMGRQKEENCAGGMLSLSLGPEPVYVRGVSPQIWSDKVEKILSLAPGKTETFCGEKGTITVKLSNPSDQAMKGALVLTADARLKFAAPRQEVELAAGERRSFDFAFEPGMDPTPGLASLSIALEESGKTVANSGAVLNVLPAVEIAGVKPRIHADGRKGLSVLVRDKKGSGFRGELQWALRNQNENGTVTVEVEPGAAREVEIDLKTLKTNADTSYPFRLVLNAGGNGAVTKTALVNFLGAAKNTTAGRVDDLTSAPLATVTLAKRNLIRAPESYNGGEATLRWNWDEKALYLTADIGDKNPLQLYAGENAWRGDSLQLAFNLDVGKSGRVSGNQVADLASRRVTEITVFPARSGPGAYRHITFDPEKLPVGPLGENDVQVSWKNSNGHSLYKITIPWKSLGADTPPVAGDVVGLAATVNDISSDTQKEPSSLGLFGGIHPQKDPARFGQMVLTGPAQ